MTSQAYNVVVGICQIIRLQLPEVNSVTEVIMNHTSLMFWKYPALKHG